LPFNLEKRVNDIKYKDKEFAYDLARGMNLAIDSLNRANIPAKIYYYDVDKDTSKILQISNYPEFKYMDLIYLLSITLSLYGYHFL
jgi:hypothetical protein